MARSGAAVALVLDVSLGMSGKVEIGGEKSEASCLVHARELLTHETGNLLVDRKKKDVLMLLAAGADETSNAEYDEYGGCENIFQVCPLGPTSQVVFETLVQAQEPLADPSTQEKCDLGDAVRVAQKALEKHVGTKKFRKRIIVITCGESAEIETLHKAAQDGDLDNDTAYEFVLLQNADGSGERAKEVQASLDELKSKSPSEGELLVTVHSEETFRAQLGREHIGTVGQVTAFRGMLRMNDQLMFHVRAFNKVVQAKPPSLKKASKVALDRDPDAKYDATRALVKRSVSYLQPNDADKEVDPSELLKGFRYGREVIPFNANDLTLAHHEAEKQLQIIGFVGKDQVPISYGIGRATVIEATPNLPNSVKAFTALVHALEEEGAVIIASFVARARSKTKMVALMPYITDEVECLYTRELPYDQDIRTFDFVNVNDSEKQPGQEQMQAMRDFVDAMDISKSGAFTPEDTLNPFLERLHQLVLDRARDPECAPALDTSEVTKLYTPDPRVLERAAPLAEQVSKRFPIQKVQYTKGKRKTNGDLWAVDAPNEVHGAGDANKKSKQEPGLGVVGQGSDGDDGQVGNWFDTSNTVTSVGSVDPVRDYNAMNAQADAQAHDKAFEGMCTQIESMIGPNGGEAYYDKALKCLVALRKGSLEKYFHEQFNAFLEGLKAKDLNLFWKGVQKEKVTLVSSADTALSEVSPEAAEAFLQDAAEPVAAKAEAKVEAPVVDDDFDDFE